MSTILKDNSTQEMAVIEEKSLANLLVIADQIPEDFYRNPAYLEQIKSATAITSNLRYVIDDDGKKAAKADVAAIRKYVKTTNGFTLSVFKSLTEKVKVWRDSFTVETKLLESNADQIMAQFEASEKAKLDDIMDTLIKELMLRRIEKNIKDEFCSKADLSPLKKLSGTMTEGGQLTKKAKDFIALIVSDDLTEQNRIEARILILENRCLRADINPPLTSAHFGTVFFASDEIFSEKLEELIATEIERRAEMEVRIIKQQEAKKQQEIEAALQAQQAEADRMAREKLEAERQADFDKQAAINHERANKVLEQERQAETPESLRESANRIEQSAQYADRSSDRNKEFDVAANLRRKADSLEKQKTVSAKRTVKIIATFIVPDISERVSIKGVVDYFIQQLTEKLASKLESVVGEDV